MSSGLGRAKTRLLLQMEAVECGAAALGIVLDYFGCVIPLEELRNQCGVSRDGSKASNIVKVATQHGLIPSAFKKPAEELRSTPTPAILYWNLNHFLVLEGIQGDKVYLNDPAVGHRVISFRQLKQSFSQIVIAFEKGPQFKPSGRRPSFWSQAATFLHPSRAVLAMILATGFFLAATTLLIPSFLQAFVDQILVRQYIHWFVPMTGGLFLLWIIYTFAAAFQDRLFNAIELKTGIVGSSRFFWNLLHLPIQFFTQRSPGEVGSRTDLNDDVAHHLSNELTKAFVATIMAVVYLVAMCQYSAILTLVAVVAAGLNIGVMVVIDRKERSLMQRLAREHGNLSGVSLFGFQAIDTLKSAGIEGDFFSRWAGYLTKYFNTQQSVDSSLLFVQLIPNVLSTLTFATLLSYGSMLVIQGALSMGMLFAFLILMGFFLDPVKKLVDLAQQIQDSRSKLIRLEDVTTYAAETEGTASTPPPDVPRAQKLLGNISIQNLTFGYSPLDTPIISNLSLDISAGTRVAFVGPSGSGKSTIIKLILGLYRPWSGTISLDGTPIQDISKDSLTHSVADVSQSIFLFDGTVRDNLTLWDSSIAQHVVIQAAKDACIHDDISALPGGYESRVEEAGRNFSGGQRQRLEIARALAQEPSLLILDEATSALDTQTELAVDDHLRRRGCTVIFVSHRLSTIRDCDQIFVVDHGQVVETGTHDDLMAKQGLYKELVET